MAGFLQNKVYSINTCVSNNSHFICSVFILEQSNLVAITCETCKRISFKSTTKYSFGDYNMNWLKLSFETLKIKFKHFLHRFSMEKSLYVSVLIQMFHIAHFNNSHPFIMRDVIRHSVEWIQLIWFLVQ